MDTSLTSYSEERAQRKEMILHIRAQLRQNVLLRKDIIKTICRVLNINDSNSDLLFDQHLTLALDEEINDSQGHVIV